MSDYTIRTTDEVDDIFGGKYPGVMRQFAGPLGAEQVAMTHRVMPPGAGGKGGYGHRHRTQEEIYFVISGTLQFKLDDDVVDVAAGGAVRVAPEVARSVHNDSEEDAELLICSTVLEDRSDEHEMVADFWPA